MRIMKTYGSPRIVTDGLCFYSATMKEIGAADRHEVGGRLNNRAENSHQPFDGASGRCSGFESTTTLQKFSSVHAQVHNHFNQERHLVTRPLYCKAELSSRVSHQRWFRETTLPLCYPPMWPGRSRCKDGLSRRDGFQPAFVPLL